MGMFPRRAGVLNHPLMGVEVALRARIAMMDMSCYGAEAYVPSNNATNTNAQYVIHFSDGTADKTVTVNQNNQMTWYTLYDIYNGGHPIFSIQLTGAGGGKTAETNMWFQCF